MTLIKWTKYLFDIVIIVSLVFLSLEIVFRRIYWKQIPTEVPGFLVWGILAANCFFLILYFKLRGYKNLCIPPASQK